MLTFEWDALRIGDRVLVHDDAADGDTLLRGEVAMVDQRRGRGANDIGIRTVELDGTERVRRPARLATHVDPMVADAGCRRCWVRRDA